MKEFQNAQMVKVPKILPLTDDIVFKRVFSREENRDILKSLLEAILDIKIRKVTVKNSELIPDFKDKKSGRLDIKAEIDDNIVIDIEMQVKNYNNMGVRSISYIGKMVSEQLGKGDDYIDLKKVIAINILNFNYYNRNSYLQEAQMLFKKSRPETYVDLGYNDEDEIATDAVTMIFIELPKFMKKIEKEPNSKLDKWMCLIAGREEMIDMSKEENVEFKKASDTEEFK